MSKFKKKRDADVPAISTASLPDIVFMLLFFFMVATVMRDNEMIVQNTLPKADQVTKLEKKDRVMFIYAGRPHERYQSRFGKGDRIQLNDRLSQVSDIKPFIFAERASRPEELQDALTTALKVDRDVKMGRVTEIKQELRKENALKINYTTNNGSAVE